MTHYFLYRVILISSKRETQNKRKEKVLRRIQIMYYNGEYYTDDDIEGMAESIGMAAEDCIWHCADGHILRSEEIASWSNEMIIEMFNIIYLS